MHVIAYLLCDRCAYVTMRVQTMLQVAESNVTVAEIAPQADTRSVCVVRTTVSQYFN